MMGRREWISLLALVLWECWWERWGEAGRCEESW